MADSQALRARRYRAHSAGIHELCLPDRCKEAGTSPERAQATEATAALADAVRDEFPADDPLSLALALRLVGLAEGKVSRPSRRYARWGTGGVPAGGAVVTRWPRRVMPEPVEPPAWVRTFDPAGWAVPDELERRMGAGLPEECRRWHAERRWHLARNLWFNEHPEADRRLEEIRGRIARRRAAR